jgi:hypothetical protein
VAPVAEEPGEPAAPAPEPEPAPPPTTAPNPTAEAQLPPGEQKEFPEHAASLVAVAEEEFKGFSDTELQLLFMFGPFRLTDKASAGAPIFTFQHFSTFKYGSNFFFLDVEGQAANPNWHFWDEKSGLYFEYAPSLSLTRMGLLSLPKDFVLSDISPTGQLNLGYAPGSFPVNRVWLGGLILSWKVPGFVTFDTQFLARGEKTYDVSWQFTLVWYAPFKIGGVSFEARGFLDFWRTIKDEDVPGTEDKWVLLTQPQFVVKLGPVYVGAELDIRHDFPRKEFFTGKSNSWDIRLGPMLLFDF